jgi:hypothetical protein
MTSHVTAFLAGQRIASGDPEAVAEQIKAQLRDTDGAVLVFDDRTGRIADLDYRNVGSRPAGRPKLGVQAREITLLPRHWEWLAEQPGGASSALRRLVDDARNKGQTDRERRDAVYRFMQAACGDMPGYEEALRALYAGRNSDLAARTADWPADIAQYIHQLLDVTENQAVPAETR